MSRLGLANQLAWRKLSPRVLEYNSFSAKIDVAGLADVIYGNSILTWRIQRPKFSLTYHFTIEHSPVSVHIIARGAGNWTPHEGYTITAPKQNDGAYETKCIKNVDAETFIEWAMPQILGWVFKAR